LTGGKEAEKDEAERKRLQAEEAELSARLGQELGMPKKDQWITLAEVQARLPQDGVLVEFARFENAVFNKKGSAWGWGPERYAAWVVPARGAPRVVDLGEAARIDEAIKEFHDRANESMYISKDKPGVIFSHGRIKAEEMILPSLRKLGDLLLGKLAPDLKPAKSWIFCPDSMLWMVPWAALPFNGKTYAVEEHDLNTLLSGRDLVLAGPVSNNPSVIYASPEFNVNPRGFPEPFGKLDYASEGVTEMGLAIKSYTGQAPTFFFEKDATKKSFVEAKRPRMVVLATHGFFYDRKDGSKGLFKCGIAFADANRAASLTGGNVGGVLFGQEVVGLDLRGTELVVLAACETNVGQVINSEGVLSLQYTFQLAGAQGVVSSLWKVPDFETSELMKRFFKNLGEKKLDKAAALCEAQRWMIKDARENDGAAHPLFWAGFGLTGLAQRR
jgi:hypothetical protein